MKKLTVKIEDNSTCYPFSVEIPIKLEYKEAIDVIIKRTREVINEELGIKELNKDYYEGQPEPTGSPNIGTGIKPFKPKETKVPTIEETFHEPTTEQIENTLTESEREVYEIAKKHTHLTEAHEEYTETTGKTAENFRYHYKRLKENYKLELELLPGRKEEKVSPAPLPKEEKIESEAEGFDGFDEEGNPLFPEKAPEHQEEINWYDDDDDEDDWDEDDDDEEPITKESDISAKLKKYEVGGEGETVGSDEMDYIANDETGQIAEIKRSKSHKRGEKSEIKETIEEWAKREPISHEIKYSAKEIAKDTGLRYQDIMNWQSELLNNGFTKIKEGNRVYFIKDGEGKDNTDNNTISDVNPTEYFKKHGTTQHKAQYNKTDNREDKREEKTIIKEPLSYDSVRQLKNIILKLPVGNPFNKSRFCYEQGIPLDSKNAEYLAVCDYVNELVKAKVLKKITNTKYRREYDSVFFRKPVEERVDDGEFKL